MLNFGFNSSIGTSLVNMCVWEVGTDGNVRGYRATGHPDGAMGSITPNATLGGEDIYEYTWDIVTGLFTMEFGDGTTQLTNVKEILITHHTVPDGNTSIWNSTNTAYEYTDLTLAQYVGVDPEEACFYADFMPSQIFSNNLMVTTGTKI